MNRNHFFTVVRVFCLTMSLTAFALVAQAQSVDPCSYGCPKDGCPQCDNGGPINQGGH
ncbi:MAG: hypothetical protein KGJ66_09485 [Alphaproteobacteria bacterium]|nr:hypothetical protein [Alphaproteobacteria bacterium]